MEIARGGLPPRPLSLTKDRHPPAGPSSRPGPAPGERVGRAQVAGGGREGVGRSRSQAAGEGRAGPRSPAAAGRCGRARVAGGERRPDSTFWTRARLLERKVHSMYFIAQRSAKVPRVASRGSGHRALNSPDPGRRIQQVPDPRCCSPSPRRTWRHNVVWPEARLAESAGGASTRTAGCMSGSPGCSW